MLGRWFERWSSSQSHHILLAGKGLFVSARQSYVKNLLDDHYSLYDIETLQPFKPGWDAPGYPSLWGSVRPLRETYNLAMDFLKDKDEELAFYNHDSNRAVAVVWPAIVENRLTDALRACMRADEKVASELFRPEGALGTFGQKIKLGYMLRLYEEDLKNDLVLLTRIRNAFAHRVDITGFEVSPIRDWMDDMTIIKIHRDLLERLKRENPQDFNGKLTLSILSSELIDYRNSFHLCIRFMIHKLAALERALKNREAGQSR